MINDEGRNKRPSGPNKNQPLQGKDAQPGIKESETLMMSGFSELRFMDKKRKAPGPKEKRKNDVESLFYPAHIEEELFQVKKVLLEIRKDIEDLWLAVKRIEISRQEAVPRVGAVAQATTEARLERPPDPSNFLTTRDDEGLVSSVETSPSPEKTNDGEDTALLQGVTGRVLAIYKRAVNCLDELKGRIVNQEPFEIEEAVALVKDVVDSPELVEELYYITLITDPEKDYRITEQICMTILALKIGAAMGYSRRQLLEIGLCAFLSNIGMFIIPEKITGKQGSLTDAEMDAVKRHTELGKTLLSTFTQFPLLAEIAYQHHERDDGSGYPLGLQGPQIREYAKIIGMVESYVAMTSSRPHREAMMKFLSARELIKSGDTWFSPAIVRAFLKAVSPYPVGSYVKLSNQSTGRVIATNPDLPMRPDVEILFDGEGRAVRGVVIKLSENLLCFIQRGLSADKVPKL